MGNDPLRRLPVLYDIAQPLVFVYLLYGQKKQAEKL